jgi:hypothetical protein
MNKKMSSKLSSDSHAKQFGVIGWRTHRNSLGVVCECDTVASKLVPSFFKIHVFPT